MKTLKDYILEGQNFLVNKKLNNRQNYMIINIFLKQEMNLLIL